jgi:hypothetical protein
VLRRPRARGARAVRRLGPRRPGCVAWLAGALALASCAGGPSGPEILAGEAGRPGPASAAASALPLPEAGPVDIAHRGPGVGGSAYRLLVETSGETDTRVSTELQGRPTQHQSSLLELEYLEKPVEEGGRADRASIFVLDALHYLLEQRGSQGSREIELGDDRLRTAAGGQVQLDLRGSQPKEAITPRKLLGKVFAALRVDARGEPRALHPKGVAPARRFLEPLGLRQALLYARVPLPEEPVEPGATWRARRFPLSPAGEIGMFFDVEYSLAGFRELDGVACAWILLRAEKHGEEVRSALGFAFERVEASLEGTAWVELGSSRLRRLVLEDEVRAAWQRGGAPAPVTTTRTRHVTRLALDLRDPTAPSERWADGRERFRRM